MNDTTARVNLRALLTAFEDEARENPDVAAQRFSVGALRHTAENLETYARRFEALADQIEATGGPSGDRAGIEATVARVAGGLFDACLTLEDAELTVRILAGVILP